MSVETEFVTIQLQQQNNVSDLFATMVVFHY